MGRVTEMKRTYYSLPLTPEQAKRLIDGIVKRFMWRPTCVFGEDKSLTIEFATMGRNLYPNESSEAIPVKLGNPVSIDSIRWEQISCYVNGFCEALEV